MNLRKKAVLSSLVVVSSLCVSMAAHAEELGPCASYSQQSLRATDYTKVNGFLQYYSRREGWTTNYRPRSAEESAYIDNLSEGVAYVCREEYPSGVKCVPKVDSCRYHKNVPEIWAALQGPVHDSGAYWVKEDDTTSCILNKRLDGTIDTSVADCMTHRHDALDGIDFTYFDGRSRTHSSVGKIWLNCSYGLCYPDYSKIYVQ